MAHKIRNVLVYIIGVTTIGIIKQVSKCLSDISLKHTTGNLKIVVQ